MTSLGGTTEKLVRNITGFDVWPVFPDARPYLEVFADRKKDIVCVSISALCCPFHTCTDVNQGSKIDPSNLGYRRETLAFFLFAFMRTTLQCSVHALG